MVVWLYSYTDWPLSYLTLGFCWHVVLLLCFIRCFLDAQVLRAQAQTTQELQLISLMNHLYHLALVLACFMQMVQQVTR
jgi:hypothetical protein